MKTQGPDSRKNPHDLEALTIAMLLVPGLYSRNRMFALFTDPTMVRAKRRALLLRSVVRQLSAPPGTLVVSEESGASPGKSAEGAGMTVLRYRIPAVHLARTVEVSRVERAALAYQIHRAGFSTLSASSDDREMIDRVLRRLCVELPR